MSNVIRFPIERARPPRREADDIADRDLIAELKRLAQQARDAKLMEFLR